MAAALSAGVRRRIAGVAAAAAAHCSVKPCPGGALHGAQLVKLPLPAVGALCVASAWSSSRYFTSQAQGTIPRVSEVKEVLVPQWSTLHDPKVLRGKPYYKDAFMVSTSLSQLASTALHAARNDGSATPPNSAVGSVAALFFGSSWFYPEKLLLDTLGAYSTANSPWAMQFQPGEDWVGFRVFDTQPTQVLLAAHEPFHRKPSGTRTWLGITTHTGEHVTPEAWQAALAGDAEAGDVQVDIIFGSALVEEDRNPNWSETTEESWGRKIALALVGFHKWYSAFLVGGLRSQLANTQPLAASQPPTDSK